MKPVVISRSVLLLGTSLLAACASSPPVTLHELASYPSVAGAAPASVARYAVRIGPVSVPQAVDQPQILLRVAPGKFSASEQQRWSSDLRGDLAQAVAEQLGRQLPDAYVFSASRQPSNQQSPRFTVALDVQRFESSLRDDPTGAVLDVAWRLQEPAVHHGQSCRVTISRSQDGEGIDGVIAAHRQAVAAFAEIVGGQVRAADGGQWQAPAGANCEAVESQIPATL